MRDHCMPVELFLPPLPPNLQGKKKCRKNQDSTLLRCNGQYIYILLEIFLAASSRGLCHTFQQYMALDRWLWTELNSSPKASH